MRIPNVKGALAIGTIVAILAGCSGGGSAPSSLPAAIRNASGPFAAIPSKHAPLKSAIAKYAPGHDIFVADYGSKVIKEIPKACRYASCVVTVGTGFSCPTFVSLDSAQDVYVSNTCDYGTAVYKLVPGCNDISCASTMPGNYRNPFGTASDKHGNLFVADYSNGLVKEVPAGCQTYSCVVQLGGNAFVGPGYYWDYGPSDIAVDKHGNVYVASYYYVSEMPANCHSDSCVTRLGGGWNNPWSISLDRHGNIYVDDYGNNEVKEMPPGCNSSSCVSVRMGGFTTNLAWAKVDAKDNVYFTDGANEAVREIPEGCQSSSCIVAIGGGFTQPVGFAVGP